MVRPMRHCRSGGTSSESTDSGSAADGSPSQQESPTFASKHTVEDSKLKLRHPCSTCGQLFALRSTWHEHMRSAHGITKPFDCDECGKRYSMLGALNYHRLTTHRGVVHACKTCGKRFMTKPGLVRHAKSHFGGVYVCEDCEKTYPTRDSLRRHRQQVHMGDKPHVCQLCQERFGASHSLNRHVKRRHQSRPAADAEPTPSDHTCHLCRKPFSSAEALRKHVQSMHRHAQYQCETCLRRFYDLSNYTRHRDSHSCTPAVGVNLLDATSLAVTPVSLVLQHQVAAAAPPPAPPPAESTLAPAPLPLPTAAAEIELSADENSEFAAAAADDEFAEFARRYGGEPAAVGGGDTVELQPVDAAELRALEPAGVEPPTAVLVPLTLAEPLAAAAGQDVYVTLYPAGETNGHRFVCVQDGDSTVFAEAPLVADQLLDVN